MGYRYEPLESFLATAAGDRVTLSWEEVERILGRELPPSSRGDKTRQWWANTMTHSQGQAWLRAGWRVANADRVRQRVDFVRVGRPPEGEPQPNMRSSVASPHLGALSPAARRMVEDYSEAYAISTETAMVRLLDETALERRRRLLSWFAASGHRSDSDTVALIREDRDGR